MSTRWVNKESAAAVSSSDAIPITQGGIDRKVSPQVLADANESKASDVASATTTDIGAAAAPFLHVTGTATITALGTAQAGARRRVVFDSALTLTHNATSLILPTGANIVTAAGDAALFVSEGGGNWRCVAYLRANGAALAGGGGGGSVDWGAIGGTLGDQADLATALAAKANTSSLASIATTGAVGDLGGFPGGTANFLRADGAFALPPGGGGGSGDVIGPGASTADAVAIFDGTTGKLLKDGVTIATIRSIPQNIQAAAYTLVAADAGGHLLHPASDTTARIWTIPANASVAFPIGTALTFVNQNGGGAITIAIASDTMRLAGAGTTGSRTLAANGIATALKVTATEWIISGTGLS